MATPEILQTEQDFMIYASLFDASTPKDGSSRGLDIEKKIEFLESLAGKVSNRRSRRWLNDRLLMELVPRLNANEIRGLFAPPPWGEDAPPSAFSMTNVGEWDNFRNIDMDKEASIIKSVGNSSSKQRDRQDVDKVAALTAWHRVDSRTREALRRCYLSEVIHGYEECIRSYVKDSGDADNVLVLNIQDPFYRLLLHGVCEVDAFTDSAFKGNPAAVCLLEDERDEEWLQAVAREFNLSETCYLTRLTGSAPKFRLRWFTPVAEVKLCGHATLAAAHFLFTHDLVEGNEIEFTTLSGILTAKKVSEAGISDTSGSFLIELDFPVVELVDYNGPAADVSTISKSLNGAVVNEIHLTTSAEDLLAVLPSGEDVARVEPNFDLIQKCLGRGLLITGLGPPGSGFDFYSRFFCPKLGINEDPVCGSAHCALLPYWSKKLGKCDLVAYQASPRGGVLHLSLDSKNQRALLRGKAIAVMEGSLLV
ncbi:uncharacterized protein LOC127258802 isoform X2 [Andrographis paniculata]|uniref:uncharacterized protein LOC127258802 isoform X2 n=1 Tax=Andrographis paniculata TaxID=175694 RepID=UPI0021E8BC29|nr:uncharacterized protein LOC127258802 isoform X2 [Andrographis paniculata]